MLNSVFRKIGTKLWPNPAEGETPVAICRIHIEIRRVEVETIGVGRRVCRTRPVVAVATDVGDTTAGKISMPATDKSQT